MPKLKLTYRINGFHIISKDTIVLHNYKHSRLYLYDFGGSLIKEIKLQSSNVKYKPLAKVLTASPLVKLGDQIYLSGNLGGEYPDDNKLNRPCGIQYNLTSDSVSYIMTYPDNYFQHNWGGTYFWFVSHTFNPKRNEIYFNFPASNEIGVYGLISKKYRKIQVLSDLSSKLIPVRRGKKTPKRINRNKHYFNSAYNVSLIYDKYRDVYYRLVYHPQKIDKNRAIVSQLRERKFTIYKYDNSFLEVSRASLTQHGPQCIFISPEGLNILKFSKDENHITFSVIK